MILDKDLMEWTQHGFFLANWALVFNKLYIICMDLTIQEFKSYVIYLCVWNITFYIALCQ